MSITALSIRNYQSLHHVDLDLAPLTVIVGPSSSGKSALVRALRTLTSNTRGSAFVSSWATRTVISADLGRSFDPADALGTLTLTRGAKTEDNSYVITPPDTDPTSANAPEERFTKLGGTVPPEVSTFLGIPADDRLRIAAQFDPPYLLADSPAEAARSFAALTNVHVVLAAARNANRTRLATSATLTTRRSDQAATQALVESFRPLTQFLPAISSAEQHLAAARDLEQQIKNLATLAPALAAADATIARTSPLLARTLPSLDTVDTMRSRLHTLAMHTAALRHAHETISRLGPVLANPLPSLAAVTAAEDALSAFHTVVDALRTTTASLKATSAALGPTSAAVDQAHTAYVAALAAAGTCPTCGQSTTSLIPHQRHEEIHA